MAETIELARPYGRFALGGIFFGFCAAVLANQASTNHRGLIINGVIHLEPTSADVFYAVLAMFSVAFVALSISAIRGLRARKTFRIVIGKKRMTMPPRFRAWESGFQDDVTIRYEDLEAIAVSPAFLRVVRRDGEPVVLAKHFVPEGWTLRRLADRILAQARARAEAKAAKASRRASDRRDADDEADASD